MAPLAGTAFCEVEHVGLVISGRATAAMVVGVIVELKEHGLERVSFQSEEGEAQRVL